MKKKPVKNYYLDGALLGRWQQESREQHVEALKEKPPGPVHRGNRPRRVCSRSQGERKITYRNSVACPDPVDPEFISLLDQDL